MSILFKSKRSFDRAFLMHPICIMILGDMAFWAMKKGLPFIVTETATSESEDNAINRKHAIHRQFRGFDVRIWGWSEQNLRDFENHFEVKYAEFAAVSSGSGNKNLIVIHDGTAPHIHVQIALIYALTGINLQEKIYEE